VWFSRDGKTWSQRHDVGDPDYWMWRTSWHRGIAHGIAYGCRSDNQHIRLYVSDDGKSYSTRLDKMYDQGYPNETAMVFTGDDTCYCLVRRDGTDANGLLGVSEPPYTMWQWKDLGCRIGGPDMIQIPDGRLLAAVRLYDGAVRTSLCSINPVSGTMTEILKLPSAGDTSYAGLVWHEERLWISYYSSHEGKASIYLARVKLAAARPNES
jgi:hypothetical protein